MRSKICAANYPTHGGGPPNNFPLLLPLGYVAEKRRSGPNTHLGMEKEFWERKNGSANAPIAFVTPSSMLARVRRAHVIRTVQTATFLLTKSCEVCWLSQ